MPKALAVGLLFALLAAAADRLPEKLVSAHTVYIQNDSGDSKLGNEIDKTLKNWGRWQIVADRSDADLIAVVDHKHSLIQNNFTFTLLDAKSSERFWFAKHDFAIKAEGVISRELTSELRQRLPGKSAKPRKPSGN